VCANNTKAESASAALKTFGLIGAWSDNCANTVGATGTYTFSTTFFGEPSIATTSRMPDGVVTKGEYKIISATRVTDEKIKIEVELTVINGEPFKSGDNNPLAHHNEVFIKIGNKIRVFDISSVDGKPGFVIAGRFQTFAVNNGKIQWQDAGYTPLLEKCLN
jgi:hypothetical protein